MPEQEVKQHADQVPRDQEGHQVAGGHHKQKRRGHEVEQREKTAVARLLGHVAHRVQVHDQADPGDDQPHEAAEGIEQQDTPGRGQGDLLRAIPGQGQPEQHNGEQKCQQTARHAQPRHPPAQQAGQQVSEQGRDQR